MLKEVLVLAVSMLTIFINFVVVNGYSNFYTLADMNDNSGKKICLTSPINHTMGQKLQNKRFRTKSTANYILSTTKPPLKVLLHYLVLPILIDPMEKYQKMVDEFIYGKTVGVEDYVMTLEKLQQSDENGALRDPFIIFPTGNIMHAERFGNMTGVHMPSLEQFHPGHCRLRITGDLMQTAVDAFSIFIYGNLDDVLQLPRNYVLKSARTISMMKISREKLSATWTVVKGAQATIEITYQTLELYRPLFKYVNAQEMSRLNLSDDRILTYIGTHPDLDRHQVGVIANKYIKMNPRWKEPKYLNLMNNLLCGIPITYMRKITANIYLQLTHQVFYHIRACDQLQKRFFLNTMMTTQALGKSYSWSARDVTRLGLLLAEVKGSALSAINPEAMSGITAQVMMEMQPENLRHITDVQFKYIEQKPLNILVRKLKVYQEKLNMHRSGIIQISSPLYLTVTSTLYWVYIYYMRK